MSVVLFYRYIIMTHALMQKQDFTVLAELIWTIFV